MNSMAYIDTNDADAKASDEKNNQGSRIPCSRIRVADSDSYSGEKDIDMDDVHYGWEIGYFFVSGYTANQNDLDGKNVFLKNVGDKVTLWFHLNQDINQLNGNEKLFVTSDDEGSDRYFETPIMDFGRGTLIIRYTDHNNEKGTPIIYTNFLEANASIGADTKVQLFEEGDYEVALDYQVTEDKLINKTGHYRIFFEFSIRNGNCMVYPFDLVTGSELTNSSMTENGFRLDLAKSRYLNVNLKRETLAESADGLVEDIRFNGAARDGAEYTAEGIYTITVKNKYTDQTTVKKIYVGTNNILKAHMTTGLSISEINNLVAQGAVINDDGMIQLATVAQTTSAPDIKETTVLAPTNLLKDEDTFVETEGAFDEFMIPALIAIAACTFCVVLLVAWKKRKKSIDAEIKEKMEGDTKK